MASEKKAYPFLLQFAFQEVKSTNSEGTLFRTDCIFTKTTIAWLKLIQVSFPVTPVGSLQHPKECSCAFG